METVKLPRPRNHPGQSRSRPPNVGQLFGESLTDEVDTRLTPRAFFNDLDAEFHFTVDAAASSENALCEKYWTRETDGLAQDWTGEIVWCNPPYSHLREWVAKAHHANATVVMLLPANRTEQPWWQTYVEPYRDRGEILTTRFIAGRMKFRDTLKETSGGAPFASVLLIWRKL